jgi:hypothetical protein
VITASISLAGHDIEDRFMLLTSFYRLCSIAAVLSLSESPYQSSGIVALEHDTDAGDSVLELALLSELWK